MFSGGARARAPLWNRETCGTERNASSFSRSINIGDRSRARRPYMQGREGLCAPLKKKSIRSPHSVKKLYM